MLARILARVGTIRQMLGKFGVGPGQALRTTVFQLVAHDIHRGRVNNSPLLGRHNVALPLPLQFSIRGSAQILKVQPAVLGIRHSSPILPNDRQYCLRWSEFVALII